MEEPTPSFARRFWPILLILGGGILLLLGVVSTVLLVGIPGPDDSPAEAARIARGGDVVFVLTLLAAASILVGTVAGIVRWIAGRSRAASREGGLV